MIELLGVMAIVAVVVGLMVPAMSNFGRAGALRTAGEKVSNLLALARQNAIAKNALTAVVVVTEPGISDRYRALAIYEMPPKADGTSSTSKDWRQVNRWELLPDGIIFDQSTFQTDPSAVLPALPEVNFRGAETQSYSYVVFLPNGAIWEPNANSIRLVEGFWPEGASVPNYTRPKNGNSPANFFNVSIIGASGRLKVDQP